MPFPLPLLRNFYFLFLSFPEILDYLISFRFPSVLFVFQAFRNSLTSLRFSCVLPNLRIVSSFCTWCFKNNKAWWQSFEKIISSICKSAISFLALSKTWNIKKLKQSLTFLVAWLMEGRRVWWNGIRKAKVSADLEIEKNWARLAEEHRSQCRNEVIGYRKS